MLGVVHASHVWLAFLACLARLARWLAGSLARWLAGSLARTLATLSRGPYLRRPLFRLLGAQGAIVSSFVILAPSIWFNVLQGDRGRRRGNLQYPVQTSARARLFARAPKETFIHTRSRVQNRIGSEQASLNRVFTI